MSILQQFKHGCRRLAGVVMGGNSRTLAGRPQRTTLELTLPNPFGGESLCRARLAVSSIRHAEGEDLRLQAHVESCLRMQRRSGSAQALPPPAGGNRLISRGISAAAGLLPRGLRRLPARVLAPVLERRVQAWLDIRTSSKPLAAGAQALVPGRLREMCRELPARRPGEPLVATWFGRSGGSKPAAAALTAVQINQEDLPVREGRRPFNLSASLATLVEDERATGSDQSDQ